MRSPTGGLADVSQPEAGDRGHDDHNHHSGDLGRAPGVLSADTVLPLAMGSVGPAVRDLQERLAALGFSPSGDLTGVFGLATRSAIEAFQHRRGLRVDGICGPQTWETVVEAGFRLGDRALYRRVPALRGDDVAELQQRLGALGFDAGRVDGIFGDHTAAALTAFQSDAGLPPDGIAGTMTVSELQRVQARHQAPKLVSAVRERELLRSSPPTLAGRHVALGETGGLSTILAALRRRLVGDGARVTSLHHPDGSAQAEVANRAGADVYVGLLLQPGTPGCRTAYYAGYRDESPTGRHLAELVQHATATSLAITDLGIRGMSLPVLRETRMPAVIVEVGPAQLVVQGASTLANAVASALSTWVGSPWNEG